MPYINRIRVNNVKYNFGTQYYDDFIMRLSGKNTIYDLANGGGKSVLLLLLMQNMIPNCTLDEKQPIEKLFRPECGNTVIHSMIEWQLNKNNIVHGLRYMTTGFCARKAREGAKEERTNRETAAVEYFNYVIFYRNFNDNDLKNLPLVNGRERVTYQGLKAYLRELGRKNNGLEVHIFERKGDYQRFVAQYGIYESEWEIIRGINKTEGHVRTYFETNYRTTRKVVEDLLIEEIIQKSFYMKSEGEGQQENMANVLLDIKDKLAELSKKKSEIAGFTRQEEALTSFIARIRKLQNMYQDKSDLENSIVRAFNTSIREKAGKENEKEELLHTQEFMKNKAREISRNIDTALVQSEEVILASMEADRKDVKEKLEAFQKSAGEAEKNLNFLESANHYLDYLEIKRQRGENRIAMEHMQDNEEELLQALKTLAGQVRAKLDERTKELGAAKEELRKEEEAQSLTLEQERNALRKAEIALAVAENTGKGLEEKEAALQKELQIYEARLGVLVFTGDEEAYQKDEDRNKENGERLEKLFKEQTGLHDRLTNIRMRLSGIKYEREKETDALENVQAFLKEYQSRKSRADGWKDIYQAKTLENLETQIMQALCRCDRKLSQNGERTEELRMLLHRMNSGHMVLQPEGITELKEWLERHYPGAAVTGIEYLESLAPEDAEAALGMHPLLPYSILIQKYYEEITGDPYLKETKFADYAIPLIDAECISGQKILFYPSEMDFAAYRNPSFYNEASQKKEKQAVEDAIEALSVEQAKLRENKAVLAHDLREVVVFLEEYQMRSEEARARHETVRGSLKRLDQEEEQLLLEMGEKKERLGTVELSISELREECERIGRRRKNFEAALGLQKEIAALHQDKKEKEMEIQDFKEDVRMSREAAKAEEKALADIEKRLQNTDDQRKKLLENWEKNYQRYFEEGPIKESTLSFAELDSEFQGKRAAFEQRNSDFEDKKKLDESYQASMDKELELIHYRGCSEQELWNMHEQQLLSRTEKEILASGRQKLLEQQAMIAALQKSLEEKNSLIYRREGSISHGKRLVTERYGSYEPTAADPSRLSEFVKENKYALEQLDRQRSEGEEKLKKLEKELFSLDTLRQDLERMMNAAGFQRHDRTDVLEKGISLREESDRLRDRYDSIRKEEADRREEYERDKSLLADTLTELGAFDLAGEVKNQLAAPGSSEEMQEQIDGLNETIRCIRLEKENVSRGIEDMNRIKENFESQCLQICLNMKAELDRLPKLSKIRLDDRLTPIITLHIPYRKEEEFQAAMEGYIDETVKNADTFATSEERLKYIRMRLTWKHLFSVIVTDMDNIRLCLYKRERIREQSRYLKYEEAVGSTGQSQGIYIQFLIAVIHYISSLNSRDADPKELKKVIFIDNPFGAAKDIYIWEPIFQLLKNNHVQLVVPARGTTPAITGRFEVNYILGQKQIDGRQQTVVVGFRSQTDEKELEYSRLSFEQEVLKF